MNSSTLLPSPALDATDRDRLDRAIELIRTVDLAEVLAIMLGAPAAPELAQLLSERATVDHVGLLVTPASLDRLATELAAARIVAGSPVPSVVVAGRLRRRYGPLYVSIVRGVLPPFPTGPAREVEVFVPMPRAGRPLPRALAAAERHREIETHLALRFEDADGDQLERVAHLLRESAGMAPDGAGHNPAQDRSAGGVTALYFARPGPPATGAPAAAAWCRRLEITCAGHHRAAIEAHTRVPEPELAEAANL